MKKKVYCDNCRYQYRQENDIFVFCKKKPTKNYTGDYYLYPYEFAFQHNYNGKCKMFEAKK